MRAYKLAKGVVDESLYHSINIANTHKINISTKHMYINYYKQSLYIDIAMYRAYIYAGKYCAVKFNESIIDKQPLQQMIFKI